MVRRLTDSRLPAQILMALVALALAAGCGGRNLGAGDVDGSVGPDGTLSTDAGLLADAEVVDLCAPMDVAEALTACDDPAPVTGWSWNGSCCIPIHCGCVGADCDSLYATQSECASARAPGCISLTPCENRGYTECEDQPGCAITFYGGGCFNPEECDPDGDPDDWICVEQAFACIPTDQPCNEREQWECDGDCFWVQQNFQLCFEQCCVDEGYGYCTGLPSCDCAPQEITGCSDPCGSVSGFYWDGTFCSPIICCCEGPDCAETWDTVEACQNARSTCPTNACGEAQGHCLYGDAVIPQCQAGFGANWEMNQNHPGVCGMGVCCTPCPDENAPGVWYASHDPVACAGIDIDCDPVENSFYNECGCGCTDSP